MPDESLFLNDLRGCSFEAWVDFAFDRPVPAGNDPNWWWHSEDDAERFLVIDPVLQLRHALRLFIDPLLLLDRFSAAQINQGFWFLSFGGLTAFSRFFADLLWDRSIPIDVRRETIGAMFDLYAKLFAPDPTDTATYMWWDLLVSDVIEERGESVVPRTDPDQEQVRLAMVSTLARILQLEQRHCQEAALHGLNHIGTPRERESLIDAFLQLPRDEKLSAYAAACRAGHAP